MALSRNDRRQLLLVLLAVLVSAAAGAALFFMTVEGVRQLPVPVEVVPAARPAPPAYVYTGSIPPGAQGVREVVLRNTGAHPALFRLRLMGTQADWGWLDRQWVMVEAAAQFPVTLHVVVPDGTPPGNYTLTVEIISHGWDGRTGNAGRLPG